MIHFANVQKSLGLHTGDFNPLIALSILYSCVLSCNWLCPKRNYSLYSQSEFVICVHSQVHPWGGKSTQLSCGFIAPIAHAATQGCTQLAANCISYLANSIATEHDSTMLQLYEMHVVVAQWFSFFRVKRGSEMVTYHPLTICETPHEKGSKCFCT